MNISEPLLMIRFDGEAVGTGRISTSHLLLFLSSLNKALQRTGRVLSGASESVRRGQPPRNIQEEVGLDLVLLTHGSPSAVLGFDRRRSQMALPNDDLGMDILQKAVAGLKTVQEPDKPLPAGYDAGVLMAWRDAGKLFGQGIESIRLTLHAPGGPIETSFTPNGHTRIQNRIKGPAVNMRTIEGRLLMADFKQHGTRCRVHPSVGEPVLCLFDEAQRDEVLENILQYVRVIGEAKEDPVTGKITSIQIHDIERLEDRQEERTDLIPQGTPITRGFWESMTLDELAEAQNARPVTDAESLLGGWPGDPDDGFEEENRDIRQRGMIGG